MRAHKTHVFSSAVQLTLPLNLVLGLRIAYPYKIIGQAKYVQLPTRKQFSYGKNMAKLFEYFNLKIEYEIN